MDLIERMKSQEENFTESELAVARYIAGHPMDVVGNTVSKVSELSGLSAAAIVRMCQRMGYSGFSEFRLRNLFRIQVRSRIRVRREASTCSELPK